MKTERLVLIQREQDLLKKHLKDSNLSAYNKRKLLDELEYASVMKADELPDDAICIESKVEIEEEISGKKFKFQIVLPTEADMTRQKISVFAPIGIALIGYRRGSRIQWEMPDGIKTFKVLNVINEKSSRENCYFN